MIRAIALITLLMVSGCTTAEVNKGLRVGCGLTDITAERELCDKIKNDDARLGCLVTNDILQLSCNVYIK